MEKIEHKSEKLFQIAKKTLEKGNRETAKRMAVLALTSEDALEALDKLLPKVPEPAMNEDDLEELSPGQVGKIMGLARALEDLSKKRIASAILARLDRIEEARKRRRAHKKP